MKRFALVAVTGLALAIAIALCPDAALAGRRTGSGFGMAVTSGKGFRDRAHSHAPFLFRRQEGFSGSPFITDSDAFSRSRFVPRRDGFADARFGHGHVGPHVPFALKHRFALPVFVPVLPLVSSVVVSTVTVAAEPVVVFAETQPSAAVAPMPRVVEYPHGRYELRGDGVTTPYVWVWIPNPPVTAPPPPSAPEPAPAPAIPPAGQVAPPAASPGEPAASPRGAPLPPRVTELSGAVNRQLYCFTDEHGVTTWTDRLETIPERHRARARRTSSVDVSAGCRPSR